MLMIAVNCIMWTTFTKALRLSSNSVEATITNTAANFLFTVNITVSILLPISLCVLTIYWTYKYSLLNLRTYHRSYYIQVDCFKQAVVSQVLLGENNPGLWWVGIVFILCGLVLLHHNNTSMKELSKQGCIEKDK